MIAEISQLTSQVLWLEGRKVPHPEIDALYTSDNLEACSKDFSLFPTVLPSFYRLNDVI